MTDQSVRPWTRAVTCSGTCNDRAAPGVAGALGPGLIQPYKAEIDQPGTTVLVDQTFRGVMSWCTIPWR